jgi:hypothetical protein
VNGARREAATTAALVAALVAAVAGGLLILTHPTVVAEHAGLFLVGVAYGLVLIVLSGSRT